MPPRVRPGSDNVKLMAMAAAPSSNSPDDHTAHLAPIESSATGADTLRDDGAKSPEDETREIVGRGNGEGNPREQRGDGTQYRVYKRRFFGLAQFILLNIIISWDVSWPTSCDT
ncbi:hypothetical protein P152DRAFT_292271 [Eremomyces bilateralis CBS 781.70]|uniref:Uncharacterized protein n=1 Tax=Eremomyces bilateralis CBS 781.70 TaxID=1392243 RepID=A0A6G1G6Y1_9PEZI|nr:uncharacterized protein P152DRAFT_292271 [Eremomyces bilateralis CBS 781.70]KAF1813803.1 hypothetical protein P152DRAFT_292271 [Eremomyces bilateralis CBS 781.70]